MSADKTQTVDAYIAQFPKDTAQRLKTVRKLIEKQLPGAEQVISYGIPTFKINGKYVIYFSGWRDHISLHPIPPKGDANFQNELKRYQTGKGTVQFPHELPLPLDFIRRFIEFQVKERAIRQ
jgi:uncharacterized protein YdhG (YjbR/CyaY superfamily)